MTESQNQWIISPVYTRNPSGGWWCLVSSTSICQISSRYLKRTVRVSKTITRNRVNYYVQTPTCLITWYIAETWLLPGHGQQQPHGNVSHQIYVFPNVEVQFLRELYGKARQRTAQVLITGPLYKPLRITKLSGGWNSSSHVTPETISPSTSSSPATVKRKQKQPGRVNINSKKSRTKEIHLRMRAIVLSYALMKLRMPAWGIIHCVCAHIWHHQFLGREMGCLPLLWVLGQGETQKLGAWCA